MREILVELVANVLIDLQRNREATLKSWGLPRERVQEVGAPVSDWYYWLSLKRIEEGRAHTL